MTTEHKPHSVRDDVEDAFSVLEKRLHPTWEIEGVQATAVLRHHFESLFEQVEAAQEALRAIAENKTYWQDNDLRTAQQIARAALESNPASRQDT
jgi:hypothetical protein